MTRLLDLWRSNKLMFLGFLLALGFTLYFVIRTAVFTLYWANPENHDREIMPWMTVRYVSHSWEIPPPMIETLLNHKRDDPGRGRHKTMGEIAFDNGISLVELNMLIETAAEAFRNGSDYQEFRHGEGPITR